MDRSTKRSSLYEKDGQGAYGIRTRATAVRGRRPRPLDECAVPRQGSRSGLSIAWRAPRDGPLLEQRRPGVLRPECRASIRARVLSRAPRTGRVPRVLGTTIPYACGAGKRTKSRTSSPKVRGGNRGRCRGATAPDEAAACRLRDLVSLAGSRWKPRRSQNRLPARIRRAPDGGADLDEDRADGETWPRPAGSATFLRPSRAAIVLRRGSPIS